LSNIWKFVCVQDEPESQMKSYLKDYNSCIFCCRNVFHISKCSALY